MKINALSQIDFYKTDHKRQYPENTEIVYSNFTPRSDKIYAREATTFWDGKVVNFGYTGLIKWLIIDLFNETFFNVDKEKAVSRYKRRLDTSLGKDAVPVDHIAELHDLGYLPIEIKALPEGSRSPIKVPVFTLVNTHKDFFWLSNYIETMMSNSLWKSYTNATIAFEFRRIMDFWYEKTGANKAMLPFSCHDFSARGMSLPYDSAMNGAAHLLSFAGTDTVAAIDYVEDYYNANAEQELIGASVSATEHSVMCLGTKDSEIETFRRLISDLYPSGIVSIVSDTWDFWKVITEYTAELKGEILNRIPNELGMAKVVFRPDSGDPVKIITGYDFVVVESTDLYNMHRIAGDVDVVFDRSLGKYFLFEAYDTGWTTNYNFTELSEAEVKGAVECLWDIFGGTVTEKGYKTINQAVGLIYGDSITRKRANEILKRLADKGFSADNIVFGVGSYTYQYNTRDTLGFAMKATYGVVDGEPREIFKDPKTDNGTKKSAKGLLRVELDENTGEYILLDQVSNEQESGGELITVFKNGELLVDEPFSVIKQRLEDSK